jgi:thioredoxin 2
MKNCKITAEVEKMDMIITCPNCGQKNKIKDELSDQQAKCGKCGQMLPLAVPQVPVHLTDANFDKFLNNAPKPILVDFWASWCGPCRMIAPVLEEFAQLHPNIIVAKVDVDANQMIAGQLNIFSIPTLILFENQQEKKRISGAMTLEKLEDHLSPWIKTN